MPKQSKRVVVRFPAAEYDALERAHRASRWSIAEIVREGVTQLIKHPRFTPEPGTSDADKRQAQRLSKIDTEKGRAE
jgi:hypothetical protein